MSDFDEDLDPSNLLNEDNGVTVASYTDETEVRTHGIRGGFYGLLLGIGLAIYLIIFKVINLSLVVPIIVIVICIALGAAWGKYAPPRRPSPA